MASLNKIYLNVVFVWCVPVNNCLPLLCGFCGLIFIYFIYGFAADS